jgi:hypothetical protein
MIAVTNAEFLQAVFGADASWAHVTSFREDPSAIPGDRRWACWAGNYASRVELLPASNQYYTISTFFQDDKGKARRIKAKFRACHVIVADDVREKLPVEQVNRLPSPSFKLETSPGSEQWGWILDTPETSMPRVENLLDGLVARGLAPDGKDPGMKGVTRYVRLPEGVNTKASKAIGGIPPRCRMLEWSPHTKTPIDALAAPFDVDLDAPRRSQRLDGAADIPDHPLLQLDDIITVKEVLSDGRFDITCPWVHEHTGSVDDGAAVFTNDDGSIGFKCHHGACQERTGRSLLDLIEASDHPGFRSKLKVWQVKRSFAKIPGAAPELPDFLGKAPPPPGSNALPPPPGTAAPPPPDEGGDYKELVDVLNLLL